MLPKTGTHERDLLNEEAVLMAEKLLQDGEIPLALYNTYMHFRTRFLVERGLADVAPEEVPEEWDSALRDAQALREHVDRTWAAKILG